MTIHKEGYPTLLLFFIVLSIINSTVYYLFNPFSTATILLSIVFYLFLISFFRKPDRSVTIPDNSLLLSPCDGKVVVIEKVFEPEYLKSDCIQVSIFMSPLNVHINWFPTDANVIYSKYHPGKYLAAWNPKASTENERTTVCYETNNKKILLRQVAGALARRIVCYAVSGKMFKQGDEMGFIKFGSRVDLYLPLDTDIKVNIGDKVAGNRSEIATI
ncbi:MAG: phosphatidylserine decarboxylase family protein [Saprospiraceae bacterium]|nr:phosphatidylserine decarboxylase family protein [Saprospiraceae bacterium]